MYIDKLTQYALTGEKFIPETQEEILSYISYLTVNSVSANDDNTRERITLSLIDAATLEGKHGWDGKKGRTNIEVKNETQGLSDKSRYNGSGMFNHLSEKSFTKYKNGGIYLQAGYTREGRLEYCIAFDMKHLIPKMEKSLDSKSGDKKNVTVNISVADYPEEIEVVYISKNLDFSRYSKRLFDLITKNWCKRTQIMSKRLAPLNLCD